MRWRSTKHSWFRKLLHAKSPFIQIYIGTVVYIIFGNVKEIKTKDEDILEISLHWINEYYTTKL